MFAHGQFQTLLKTLAKPRRRGTILLLVLGALAMVLILTVVYAALGKGDRTTGRAVNQQRAAVEVVDRFGEHVVGIIGDDVTDVVPNMAEERILELIDPTANADELARLARYLHERWDSPTSDFSMLSVPSEADNFSDANAALWDLRRFRPTGGHSTLVPWPENTGIFERLYSVDPRIAADPWLASIRPTDFGVNSKIGLVPNYDDAPFYARALDWLHISNVAPDGRFVNLAFLRDNFGVPSLDLTRDPDNNDVSRLTLFDAAGRLQVGDPGAPGYNSGPDYILGMADVLDYADVVIDGDEDVLPEWNVPAHWTMYQRNMARTISELSRNDFNANDPSSATYWEYSYADADGDGIIDSRWFELVDASSGLEVPLLGDTGRRYFAAVRVIDLSGLVNVNTASDAIEPPTLDNRAGQGPQDVSLFTLLTLNMHRQAVTGVGRDVDGPYGGTDDEATYESFFTALDGEDDRNDYEDLDEQEQVRLGRKTYLRLRDSLLAWQPTEYGTVPGEEDENAIWSADLRDYTPYAFTAQGPDGKREDYSLFGSAVPGFAGGGNARTGPFAVSDLIELLTFHGVNDPEVFSALEQAFTIGEGDPDDPLYTRSLLRADRTFAAEAGVELSDGTTGPALTPEELNRRARAQLDIRSLLTTVSGARPIRAVTTDASGILVLSDAQRRFRADELMLGGPTYEGIGETDTDAIRTFQNRARNPLIRNGFEVYLRTLAPHLDEFRDGDAWPLASGTLGGATTDHIRTLFYGHEGAEMALRMAAHMAVNFRDAADAPFVDVEGGPDGVPDPGTLLRAEENGTALEIAIDGDGDGIEDSTTEYAERRDEPSRALLWLISEDQRDSTNAEQTLTDLILGPGSGTLTGGTALEDEIAVLDADEVLEIPTDESVLATNPGQTRSADAMIVYGVEAQPFLSEVFYMNAYWDAPRGNIFVGGGTGADSDYIPDNPDTGEYSWDPGILITDWVNEIRLNPDAIRGMVNIDGRVPSRTGPVTDNRDFLFQIAVFQLFNPFDVPVSLEHVYIEWAGAVYRPLVLGTSANDFLLEPGETRLLYATNPGNPTVRTERRLLIGISSRISQIMSDAQTNSGNNFTPVADIANRIEEVINSIVPTSADSPRIPLMRFDPTTGAQLDSLDDLLAGDQFAATGKELNSIVHLWWDVGDRFGSAASPGAARRDDILIDRMVDPELANATALATLDQRLRLGDRSFSGTGGLFPVPAGEVRQAFLGDDVDSPGTQMGGPEVFGILGGGFTNLNVDQQRSVALWSRIRRFETAADETGSGGRAANLLGMPDGSASNEFPSAVAPAGATGTAAAPAGDLGISGIPFGALPAAAIETDSNIAQRAEDVGGGIRLAPDRLNFSRSFTSGTDDSFETALTLDEFFPLLRDEFAPERNETVFTSVVGPERYDHNGTDLTWTSYTPLAAGSSPAVPYRDDRLIQISHNSREFRTSIDGFPQLRVGDLLNVLAVGPYRMPLRTTGIGPDGYPTDPDQRVAAYTEQWTTLSEVLGVAEGVLTNLEPAGSTDFDAFEDLAGVLDRGHLRLNAYVPYVDFEDDDGDGSFENDPFNPEVDRARGLGIPAALNIFDIAQAGGELPERAYGGLDRPIAGLVNINTAPPSVLRLLPGMYQDAIVDEDESVWPAWTGRARDAADDAGLEVAHSNVFSRGSASDASPSGSGGVAELYEPLDVASSILSYREASSGYRRLLNVGGITSPDVVNASLPLNMGPLASLDNTGMPDLARGVAIFRDFVGDDMNGDTLFDVSGPNINGLRTAPGFGSIGELMAVRPGGDIGMNEDARRFQFGMDWIARDRRTVSQLFIDPVTGNPGEPSLAGADWTNDAFVDGFRNDFYNEDYRILSLDPSLLGDPLRFSEDAGGRFQLPVADQIPDDYDEQLIQMNMLTNAVSTSSDFYAAWMVIHGFEDDDVEDLDPNEPMRPSFRTRYLMIVDRSNVVSRGDTPRVLAFLEVPYGEEVRNPVYAPE